MFGIFDKETGYKYSDAVKRQIVKQEFLYVLGIKDYKKAKDKFFNDCYRELPVKERIKINIKLYLPWVVRVKNKLHKKK